MRRATQNVAVLSENGNILLSFGYDYCAEHEWGLRGLNREFGVSNDEDDTTTQRYAVTRVPDGGLHLLEADAPTPLWLTGKKRDGKHRRLYLLGGDERPYSGTLEDFVSGYRESYPQPDKPEGLWDDSAFLFSVPADHKHAEAVRKIHAALLEGNALMYRAAAGLFGGSGLVIVRRSTIPRDLIAKMEGELDDKKRLRAAAEATGIRERVEAWARNGGHGGHGLLRTAFYALSPAWKRKGSDHQTKHPVIFWLNPTAQDRNNAGWFTVEELEQWMDGKGPIPKRAVA